MYFYQRKKGRKNALGLLTQLLKVQFDAFQKTFNLKSNKREEMYNELFPNMIKNVQISNEKF